jgi:hypothetical protein
MLAPAWQGDAISVSARTRARHEAVPLAVWSGTAVPVTSATRRRQIASQAGFDQRATCLGDQDLVAVVLDGVEPVLDDRNCGEAPHVLVFDKISRAELVVFVQSGDQFLGGDGQP